MKKLLAVMTATLVLVTIPTVTSEAEATHKPKPVKKPVVVQHPRVIAEKAARSHFRSTKEWLCLKTIWEHESHFNPKARNKKSGAYGIAQFLPQTWKNYKVKKTSNAALQIKYGLRYIVARYKTPCRALAFRKRHGYY